MAALSVRPRGEDLAVRHARAWLGLVAALTLHVIDEAATGFLDFYNPLVTELRQGRWWFPARPFQFDTWISGLVAAIVLLGLLAPAVRRGARGTRVASWIFAGVMLLNGIGHLAGSAYVARWLPGATSAPLLIGASLLLMRRVRERARPVS